MKEYSRREFRGLSNEEILSNLPLRIKGLGILGEEGGEVSKVVKGVRTDVLRDYNPGLEEDFVEVGSVDDLSEADKRKLGSKGEYRGRPTHWRKSLNGNYLVEWYDEVPEGFVSAVVVRGSKNN